ncbi:hypothetical protein [Solibacillus sp. FSL H8-0538]|uniref:hypothetical protein n=1 Tax=Solibacillus sp. FSL H8-0538 TaxID=2921400 RepID=UPI0030FA4C1F
MLVTKALPQDVAYLAFVPIFPPSGSRLAPRKAFAATEINDIEEKSQFLNDVSFKNWLNYFIDFFSAVHFLDACFFCG